MEGNVVASFAGVGLSLLFGYAPGFKTWFEALDGTRKALVMLVLLLGAAITIFALSCWGPYTFTTCDQAGGWKVMELFVAAVIANQGTYQIAVKPFKRQAA